MCYKPTILFSLLAIFTQCFTFQLPISRLLSTNYVTTHGNVTLNKDNYGFYVNVDFSDNINQASDSEGYDPSLAHVSLALYTSKTILTYSCLGFSSYYCQSYGCSESINYAPTLILPDFQVTSGYLATAEVFLDYDSWSLKTFATIATSCFSYQNSSYGSQRYGIVGLGINDTEAISNFDVARTFYISVAQDLFSGTLLFGSDPHGVVTSNPKVGTLTSTAEWQINSATVLITIKDAVISATVSAIFDLNANGLGFPSSVFGELLSNFEDQAGVNCLSQIYLPICYYTGKIKDLPTITLSIQGVSIDLPPTLYVVGNPDEDTSVEQITLNFRSLDPTYTGNNYVTSDFESYIIFDQTFLSFYYAEFAYNNANPTVTLYSPFSSSIIWPYITGGVVGLVIIIIVIACCIKRRRNKRRLAQGRSNNPNLNGLNQSEEVPLAQVNIPSAAVVNYPSYDEYVPQLPSQENRAYNFNNNVHNNNNNNSEPGALNFTAPVPAEQIRNSGEGYVPPVLVEEGNQAGNQQGIYSNDYLQARQAFIRGDMSKPDRE